MRATRRSSIFATFLLLSLVAALPCAAQDFPNRPVRLIVANAAGSSLDLVARVIAPGLSSALGQPVIVENKAGANNVIGFEYVARQAPADGYTIAVVQLSGLGILPVISKNLRFDPLKDLPPMIGLGQTAMVFGSAAHLPWKNFGEMVATGRASPGKLNYGVPTPSVRILTEALIRGQGIEAVPVAYSNNGSYSQGLLTGEVQMAWVAEAQMDAIVNKFRPLAVTGEHRLAAYPEVPTLAELGYKTKFPDLYYSLHVRSGTPKSVIDTLHAAASKALAMPSVKAGFSGMKIQINELPPEAVAKTLDETGEFYADIAKKIGLQPQ